MNNKSPPKTIATINFKGGVGKTTITWCLGDLISTHGNSNTLLFDLDAQMSLTQAITLNEDGSLYRKFSDWHERSEKKGKTIFKAIEAYTGAGAFDFGVNYDFIYQITDRYHFIPSAEDLYWLELDVFDRQKMQGFIRELLGKITWSKNVPDYNYALFDCPPSFTLLSYSILSVCDLILIPVNPDFYAVKGVPLILNTLQLRIEPFPIPKIAVFMNKAKPYGGTMTKESQFYWNQVKSICAHAAKKSGLKVKCLDTPIYERVALKRAVTTGGVPAEFVPDFKRLWSGVTEFLND
ncbi:MAG: ParA family protein [Verrucomicrobia bacterium]|nr:ParA family protein [Verrucomicrobiota bacterium]